MVHCIGQLVSKRTYQIFKADILPGAHKLNTLPPLSSPPILIQDLNFLFFIDTLLDTSYFWSVSRRLRPGVPSLTVYLKAYPGSEPNTHFDYFYTALDNFLKVVDIVYLLFRIIRLETSEK